MMQQLFTEILSRCGSNLYGEPWYRLVWSEDRLEYRDGEMRLKYGVGRERWMLERWCPPEFYGDPEQWESLRLEDGTPILGPFPRRGDYEHSYTFEADGQFVKPTEELVLLLVRCIEAGKMHTRSERWAAIKQAHESQNKAWKRKFDDIWDEAQGPFQGNAVSGIPSKKLPEDMVLRYSANDLPRYLKRKSGFSQITKEN